MLVDFVIEVMVGMSDSCTRSNIESSRCICPSFGGVETGANRRSVDTISVPLNEKCRDHALRYA